MEEVVDVNGEGARGHGRGDLGCGREFRWREGEGTALERVVVVWAVEEGESEGEGGERGMAMGEEKGGGKV